jgi:hypothetical protein
MALRTGILTREEWSNRIDELLVDITKEDDVLCQEILELVIDRALDFKDDRQDEIDSSPS